MQNEEYLKGFFYQFYKLVSKLTFPCAQKMLHLVPYPNTQLNI